MPLKGKRLMTLWPLTDLGEKIEDTLLRFKVLPFQHFSFILVIGDFRSHSLRGRDKPRKRRGPEAESLHLEMMALSPKIVQAEMVTRGQAGQD